MTTQPILDEDIATLHSMGYAQELLRRMSGFSNYAISLSIICILAGCITSFHIAFSSVGGAAIGLGWPLGALISLCFALTMAQVASAFPTAGGLYHWASMLGNKAWGWVTAWFNLAGLITVLAAINVGTVLFANDALGPLLGFSLPADPGASQLWLVAAVALITFSHAYFNHKGIRVTTLLTDFSGYMILAVAIALTVALLVYAPALDFSRLIRFTNFSGPAGADVWPATANIAGLFLLGLLLPAYTITGFDASAHTAEETLGAARNVPKGIVRAVLVSSLFGWLMLCAVVLAIPDMPAAAAQGGKAFTWIVNSVLPQPLALVLYAGIFLAQYLCGLATMTSASRMVFAFARDGGLPASDQLRRISVRHRTPATAIWAVAILSVLFAVYTPVYSTITVVCVIFLYISYLLPTFLGLLAYKRTWTQMGPWDIGRGYRPLAAICTLGFALLFGIGIQPPNDKALTVTLGFAVLLGVTWFAYARHRFQGPPTGQAIQQRQQEIAEREKAVGETGELDPELAPQLDAEPG